MWCVVSKPDPTLAHRIELTTLTNQSFILSLAAVECSEMTQCQLNSVIEAMTGEMIFSVYFEFLTSSLQTLEHFRLSVIDEGNRMV